MRQHIEVRLRTRLTSPALAKLAGLSVAGFNRAFRRHFGCASARYVTEMRVREAARLLLQSHANIDAIAEQSGFANRAYFSRVFKQVTDEGPAGFRSKHQRMTTGSELSATSEPQAHQSSAHRSLREC